MSAPKNLVLVALLVAGCSRSHQSHGPGGGGDKPPPTTVTRHIELPKADERNGTAVVILVDTSGSMAQAVPDGKGKQRPKNQIAQEALHSIVGYTTAWQKSHAGAHLQLGIFNFSSRVHAVLPMGEFDTAKAEAAVGRIPTPNGGTAIGLALEEGYKALYRSGCTRKFILCVTDGENTSGPSPDYIAHQLYEQTSGAVKLNFVAFDTKASHFRFVPGVGGHVVEAADGGKLQVELTTIYEKKILAEVPDEPSK
jgi:Mg-chelatase subunit ChlD